MIEPTEESPTPADWCAYRAALRTREANLLWILRDRATTSARDLSPLSDTDRADALADLAAVRDAMREEG